MAAPIVSRGKRVASSPPGGKVVVDGVYRTKDSWAGGHPTPAKPSWVAIDVGAGPLAPPRLLDLLGQPRLHRPEVRGAGRLPDRDLGRLHRRRRRHLANGRHGHRQPGPQPGPRHRLRRAALGPDGGHGALPRRLRVGALPRRDRRARPLPRRRRRLGLLRRQHHLGRLRPRAGAPAQLPGGHRAPPPRLLPGRDRRRIRQPAPLRRRAAHRRGAGAQPRCEGDRHRVRLQRLGPGRLPEGPARGGPQGPGRGAHPGGGADPLPRPTARSTTRPG